MPRRAPEKPADGRRGLKGYVDSPADALRTATSNAAATLNYDLPDFVGYVEKGRFADIVAVPGDPLKDISTMENIKFVMKGGAVFRNEFEAGATPLNLSRPAGSRRSSEGGGDPD